ncbi:hypothetical protein [Aurantiacibacter zhengii]|uniref:Uncharacterized protein n=1 Tax=Aurantiacibacter zhengii TaxID=2307003 RepID=A0A418NU59_9SPHN|nr:hypothetical protein [Aurantiacibacter zhengii]RIV87504.1 hypothetical protein D2V07_03900 [Aurantiacibacter zhengii]
MSGGAGIGGAIQAIGSLIGGVGGFVSGQRNKDGYYAQAREERRVSNERQRLVRQDARRAIGAQFAAQASNGMVANSGTAIDAIRESLLDQVLDVRELRRQGEGRAKALRRSGKDAEIKGYFDLATGLFGAGASAYDASKDWAQARNDSYG